VACVACTGRYLKKAELAMTPHFFFLPLFSTLPESALFVSSTIMAPPLNAAQHILIKTLLKEGFGTELIATKASCSIRAVQRIHRKRQQPEMPTPRTNHVGRRSCITLPMKKALLDTLTEQPYLYRCEMADFLSRRFRRKISPAVHDTAAENEAD
jgi:hypothetical protein